MKKTLIFILFISMLWHSSVCANQGKTDEIRIAVIDTGISTIAIDSDRLIQGYNYMDDQNDTEDKIGHGTAIAGILVGDRKNYVTGMVPNAVLVPLVCQTKDEEDRIKSGNHEVVAKAVLDAVDLYQCRIINISIGITEKSDQLQEAMDYAERNDVLVIASVGNSHKENPDAIYYPAAYPTVIGVGSVSARGNVSSFSQKNPSVNLMAQGEKVWTVSIEGNPLMVQGTSYATAYVTGAAAALMESYPALPVAKIRRILYQTAEDILQKGYDTDSGWGIVQPVLALQWETLDKKTQLNMPVIQKGGKRNVKITIRTTLVETRI